MPRQVAALYIRVSTDEQAQHGHSLEAQKDALKKFARQRRIKYHRLYEDAGRSGKDLDRPALQQMLTDIYDGKITEVIVWKIDRLTRSNLDLLELVEFFRAYEVTLASVTEPMFDVSTPTGMFMLSLLGNLAQMERGRLVERINLGLKKRREQHKWTGSPPYGYDYDPQTGTLRINANEANTVKIIFEEYHRMGTLPAVKLHLSRLGIMSRANIEWRESSIGKILNNQIYLGKIKQGDVEWPDESLRIIDKELFQACQTQRAARKKYSPKLKEMPNDYEKGSFCPNCGRHCINEMKYCPGCGSHINHPIHSEGLS